MWRARALWWARPRGPWWCPVLTPGWGPVARSPFEAARAVGATDGSQRQAVVPRLLRPGPAPAASCPQNARSGACRSGLQESGQPGRMRASPGPWEHQRAEFL